jgi:MFS family permease
LDNEADNPGSSIEPPAQDTVPLETRTIDKEPTYLDVFKNKDFMKLLSGQFFSNFADAIFRIAIQLYVYAVTLSITAMTLILAAQTIPWIIIGPIAGVFADRISRKALMVGADIIRGTAILILPFISSIYGIAVIAFLLGAASATFVAPRSAAIPEITGLRLYVKAISLSQLVFQTLAVVGPLFAAPIYVALGQIGPPPLGFAPYTFIISAGCYFISAAVIFVTNIPSAERDETERITMKLVLRDMKEGFNYLVRHPTVRLLLFLFTFIILGTAFAGPLLLPYLFEISHNAYAVQYMNTPQTVMRIYDSSFVLGLKGLADREFGFIGAASAVGAIAGNLLFGRFEKRIGRPLAISLGSIAISGYYFIFLFKPSFYAIIAVILVQGILNGMFSLAINALFAENVPNEVRGRAYSATNAYIQVFSVMCYSLSGLTAESIGIIVTIAGSGIFLLATTVIIMVFTKFYRFASEPPNPTLNLSS